MMAGTLFIPETGIFSLFLYLLGFISLTNCYKLPALGFVIFSIICSMCYSFRLLFSSFNFEFDILL